MNEAVSI
jgi:hypothetical protein